MLADERARWAAAACCERASDRRVPARQWLARTVAELAGQPGVTLLARSTVFGYTTTTS